MTAGRKVPATQPADGEPRPTNPPTELANISRLTRIFSQVVAPATLLTALLFYFGWSFAYWFFDYLGVNSTLLGLTTQDYLMRSVDGLFFPMLVVAVLTLAILWGRAVLPDRLDPEARDRLVQFGVPVIAVVGVLLVANGISRVFGETVFNQALVVAPLSLVSGVLLLAYAVHARRRTRALADAPARGTSDWRAVVEWAGVFLLVGLGLFWAANDYSAALGATRARELVANLASYPSAVLYSERSLSLHAPGVSEVRCSDPEAAYRFRYDGLTLVLQSGDQYLLLPTTWAKDTGVAIVVPRSNDVRLEFVRPSARQAVAGHRC